MAKFHCKAGLIVKEKFAWLPVVYRINVYGIKGFIWLQNYYEYRVNGLNYVFRDKCSKWKSIDAFYKGY